MLKILDQFRYHYLKNLNFVKRDDSEHHLYRTSISFALTVIIIRLYLEATGYPQIGFGAIHFSHVLLGGLILYVASILPLITVSPKIFKITSILSGIGVGLFIDEVGKFITRSNDYFYPPAMPIIYAFFLLTVLLFWQIKKKSISSNQEKLLLTFNSFGEIIDQELDPQELDELKKRLFSLQKSGRPELAMLASNLAKYLNQTGNNLEQQANIFYILRKKVITFFRENISHSFYRWSIIVMIIVLTINNLADLSAFFQSLFSTAYVEKIFALLIAQGSSRSQTALIWYLARLLLEGIIGLGLLYSLRLFLIKKDKAACQLIKLLLLISLTMINLLAFYFDQTKAIFNTLIQFALFLYVQNYRERYL